MPYIPHTPEDTREMLEAIGVSCIDDLFREIPDELKLQAGLNLPPAMDEYRLYGHLKSIADKNVDATKAVCFLGAGIYDRYIPASVGAVISRGEFLTAYTPYQPEASQGYLQTIYEFQSMVAYLYDMDLANASMYDGATSMAEAAIMASGVNGRGRVAVSEAVHPHYRQVLNTYLWAMGMHADVVPCPNGRTDDWSLVHAQHACVVVQYPNFLGQIEHLDAARAAARANGAMLIVVADPTAMGLLPPPGKFDADVVVGEGQPLGIPMGFGGPMLGLFACKSEFARRIPGRIVGHTCDTQGRCGYTMTLRTREQDIRREKATSNICTNEALMALASAVYLSAVGKRGLRSVAESTVRNTQYAIDALTRTGAKLKYGRQVFGEFVLELPKPADEVVDRMLERGILAGLPLGCYYPGMAHDLLVAVTEVRTKAEIDEYAQLLVEVLR